MIPYLSTAPICESDNSHQKADIFVAGTIWGVEPLSAIYRDKKYHKYIFIHFSSL